MKKRKKINFKMGLVLIAVAALVLVILPVQTRAQDSDSDGFEDALEMTGVSTLGQQNEFLPCADPNDPIQRPYCVDQFSKDLFVILWEATGSFLPEYPLEDISQLGIGVHQIIRDKENCEQFGRQVCPESDQNAVRITEDNITTLAVDEILGEATYGTPNYLDDAMVYTYRVWEWIHSVSDGKDQVLLGDLLTDTDPVDYTQNLDALIDIYTKHIIAHEAGHAMRLAQVPYSNRFDGYHYKAGTGVHMDQHVFYTNKKGKVVWYIPTQYSGASVQGLRLK